MSVLAPPVPRLASPDLDSPDPARVGPAEGRPFGLWPLDDAECLALAEEFPTPTFAYRADVARSSWLRLREALPERVRLAYAVKANPLPELLSTFADLGSSFDVASAGELGRVRRLGVGSGRIFFAGPGKSDREIELAVRLGVRLQAEGLEDLRRVSAAAHTLDLRAVDVNLRVQPAGVEEAGSIIGGGGPTAFGVDEEDLGPFLEQALALDRVRIRGLHGFAASNERCAERLLANHRRMFSIAGRLRRENGLEIEQIDLGGGLGIAYAEHEHELDVEALGKGLARLLEENAWFRGELILEPGRFLAGPCGVYLARVVRTKVSRGEAFAILEGGIHHLLRPLLTGQPFPVRRVPSCSAGPTAGSSAGSSAGCDTPHRRVILAGPLCTGLDRLGTVELPPLRPGDLLAFGRTGAYGATEAMVPFLDHPPAGELWCTQGARGLEVRRVAGITRRRSSRPARIA